jgi:hypothetical protein
MASTWRNLAGLPAPVIQRANEIMAELEKTSGRAVKINPTVGAAGGAVSRDKSALDELKDMDVNSLSPIEALNKLFEWQKKFTLLIASPWWAAMLIRHGITPFLSASQSGFHDFAYFYAFFIAYTQETFIPLIAVFAWVGILYLLSKREFTLPILFALPFLIEPRNAPNVGILIIPMLAARAVIRVLLPSFKGSQITVENDNPALLLSATSQKFFAAILAFCLIVGMQIFDSELSENRVRPETQLTYAWIKNHTPPESRFVLLSGNVKPLEDFNNEWFPVLTGRVSLTTLQGLEWDEDIDFTEHSMWLSDVQMCRFDFETLACLRNLGLGSKEKFDYLIVFRETLEPPLYLAGIPSWATNEGRSVVYESNEILIVEFP